MGSPFLWEECHGADQSLFFFKAFSSSFGTKNTAVGVLGAGLGLAGQQGRSMDNHCAEFPYVLWYGESKK